MSYCGHPDRIGSELLHLETNSVPKAIHSLASSSGAFLDHLRSHTTTPIVFRAASRRSGRAVEPNGIPSQAEVLLRVLREAGDRLVEVEAGRYDKLYGRVEMPLSVYLDWLIGKPDRSSADVGEHHMQLYLAQWRARNEVPELAKEVRTPSLLAPLLQNGVVDLYQSSFFIGPAAAVSPLHRDPYDNLYHLLASSQPATQGKHFLLLPPSLTKMVAPTHNLISRNTSQLELRIYRASAAVSGFEVKVDPTSAPIQTTQAVLESSSALSCVLQEGDMMFLPRGWWHRVENVVVDDTPVEYQDKRGWTAGVGWWFLSRKT